MIRIDLMSVRLGIGLRKIGTKKGRAIARPPDRDEGTSPARERVLDQNQGGGKGSYLSGHRSVETKLTLPALCPYVVSRPNISRTSNAGWLASPVGLLAMLDWDALCEAGDFDPSRLHNMKR
jgi:hypothetical protein